MWKQAINLLLGIWLIITSFSVSMQNPIHLLIVGLMVAITGFLSYKSWLGIVNGLLGAWLFVCGVSSALITSANFLLSGLIITLVSNWDLDLHTDNDAVPHR